MITNLQHPFHDERTYLDWCKEVDGWGVYSNSLIPAESIIEVAPVIVYPKAFIDTAIWVARADGMKDEDYMLDRYSLVWDSFGVAIPMGWVGIYNHSDKPNARFVADHKQRLLGIMTLKDIYPEEQITVSYGNTWFKSKPYITKVEL